METQIEKQIEIAAPVSRVWRALTDYRQFGEWFLVKMDGPFVAGKPIGGQITHPGYEHLRMEIVIKAIELETLFSYTWHPYAVDPKVDYTQGAVYAGGVSIAGNSRRDFADGNGVRLRKDSQRAAGRGLPQE